MQLARSLLALATDAQDTTARMRRDARHLREIGQRAAAGVIIAGRTAQKKIERALEDVADTVLEVERRVEAARAARARGAR